METRTGAEQYGGGLCRHGFRLVVSLVVLEELGVFVNDRVGEGEGGVSHTGFEIEVVRSLRFSGALEQRSTETGSSAPGWSTTITSG